MHPTAQAFVDMAVATRAAAASLQAFFDLFPQPPPRPPAYGVRRIKHLVDPAS